MLARLRKILQLEGALFQLSAITDLQQPLNLLMQFANDIAWYSAQIGLFEILYLHTSTVGDWTLAEVRVFLGLIFIVDSLQMVLFARNFDTFSEKVSQRDLDLMLLRPVSTQQLMTCQKLQCGFLLNFAFGVTWLLWALSSLPQGLNLSQLALLMVVVPAGLSVFYSTRLLVCSFTLLMTRAEQLHEFYMSIFRLGLRPDHVYTPGLRYIILLVLPTGMIASVPTRVLVEPSLGWALPALLGVSLFFCVLSRRFWKWSVRRYMTTG